MEKQRKFQNLLTVRFRCRRDVIKVESNDRKRIPEFIRNIYREHFHPIITYERNDCTIERTRMSL
ncbi:hypothetical protein DICVIV_03299 [Dictyocaulus viviparus]|uniref:Uncharacterized protein n=1 Tax=Dictyocaulus viviparus TaxID=29172 RepID=A0A0D8Y3C8_DICVI|nr:hypothetical protein DICVIV_03299 [Dictyocaulus viviparus]